MAFTEAQRIKVRQALGYSSVAKDTWLESALDAAGAVAAVQSEVETILAALASVDTKMADGLDQAGLKRADTIEFFGDAGGGAALTETRSHGAMWAQRLAALLDVPVVGNPYSGGRQLTGRYELA